jgi:hypothetical protein
MGMDAETGTALIDAIRRVAATVRVSVQEAQLPQVLCAAIERVSATVRERGDASARELLKRIKQARLSPYEPFDLHWNPFRLFGVESDEPAWTQWFGALLDPRCGQELARVAWAGLCTAAARSVSVHPFVSRQAAASWQARALKPPMTGQVTVEYSTPTLGTPDLVVELNDDVILLENKLWEDWHDWSLDGRQADRYRKIGLRLAGTRKLHLVLLSARPDLEYVDAESPGPLKVPRDWLWIPYAELARGLRAAFRSLDIPDLATVWPILLTIAAIERDVLGLDVPSRDPTWRDLSMLSRAVTQMEGA